MTYLFLIYWFIFWIFFFDQSDIRSRLWYLRKLKTIFFFLEGDFFVFIVIFTTEKLFKEKEVTAFVAKTERILLLWESVLIKNLVIFLFFFVVKGVFFYSFFQYKNFAKIIYVYFSSSKTSVFTSGCSEQIARIPFLLRWTMMMSDVKTEKWRSHLLPSSS